MRRYRAGTGGWHCRRGLGLSPQARGSRNASDRNPGIDGRCITEKRRRGCPNPRAVCERRRDRAIALVAAEPGGRVSRAICREREAR